MSKIIIIGAGISGPVLATFLKLKGFDPVIYEKRDAVGDNGLCLMIYANGLQVLNQIPGFLKNMPHGSKIDKFRVFTVSDECDREGEEIYSMDSEEITDPTGSGMSMTTAMRTAFHKNVIQCAVDHGVEIKWGHKLLSIKEEQDSVTAVFENGETATGAFIVGCDGLHSSTRVLIFGVEKPQYTGIVQTSGISSVPADLGDSYSYRQWYGNGTHMFTFRPSADRCVWVTTRKGPESKDSWKEVESNSMGTIQTELLKKWNFGLPKQLIENSIKIIKYGCYDRPVLKTWHKGRVVLIGDAAHPPTPHVGQGANHAFEDIHELVRCLLIHNPSRTSFSLNTLEVVFTEYANNRYPRSVEMVQRSRAFGDSHVTEDESEREARVAILMADLKMTKAERLESHKSIAGEIPVDLMSMP